MSLRHALAAGGLAAVLQLLFLQHFAAPLAEQLHEVAAGEHEEEYAYWAAYVFAFVSGSLWGVVLYALARPLGLLSAALAAFVAFSLLPGLKWLPTPHGVSYVEPVWWRELIHGMYLLYNGAALLAALRLTQSQVALVAAVALLVVGFYAFPAFTLPESYGHLVPVLKALQGLSIASWAFFWGSAAALTYALSPVKRPWVQ